MIYLRHPKHGVKIASMEMEAQYDESHGWSRFDPDAQQLPDAPEQSNVMLEPRRRGRPRLEASE
jgi:hypothetical protein